jgi:beta-N-acetylhexosaminidase
MVLFPMDVEQAIDAVFAALDRGLLEEKHLLASARRILKLKERFGITDASFLPGDDDADAAFAEDHRCLARRLAERSITLVVDRNPVLPLTRESPPHIVVFELPNEKSDLAALAVVDGSGSEALSVPPFQNELEQIGCRVTWVTSLAGFDDAVSPASVIVYITRSRPQAGRNSIRLSYNAIQSIDFERIFSGFPCVVLSLGTPCLSWELPNLPCLICTYSGGEEAQRAAARAICGEIPFTGRLPIQIPEFLLLRSKT